jgi:acetyl esterase/lipase
MFWFLFFILILIVLWAVAESRLAGPDLSHFDFEVGEKFAKHDGDDEATRKVLNTMSKLKDEAKASKSIKKGFAAAREFADNLSQDLQSDCEFRSVTANGVPCEWAIAPNADPKRRVLMFHGGAFLLGSPKGHRLYAHNLSHLANAAVLSVDYRMLPEHKRLACAEDAQSAYQWILTQGPDGPTELDKLIVAGDSAGGNLALMLSNWSRTHAARKPDAVLGFSPSLDTTLDAPSVAANLKSDKILGEGLGLLKKLPEPISLWIGALLMRTKPNNPIISPLFAELSNLPPTLLHASDNECLVGDAIRFTNKASAAGSDVTLQLWEDQLHDWHIFTPDSGSGKEAWAEVGKFLDRVLA